MGLAHREISKLALVKWRNAKMVWDLLVRTNLATLKVCSLQETHFTKSMLMVE